MSIYKMSKIVLALLLAGGLAGTSAARAATQTIYTSADGTVTVTAEVVEKTLTYTYGDGQEFTYTYKTIDTSSTDSSGETTTVAPSVNISLSGLSYDSPNAENLPDGAKIVTVYYIWSEGVDEEGKGTGDYTLTAAEEGATSGDVTVSYIDYGENHPYGSGIDEEGDEDHHKYDGQDISADFVGDHSHGDTGSGYDSRYGGAIYNKATTSGSSALGTITGNFIGNYEDNTTSSDSGGAIENFGNGGSSGQTEAGENAATIVAINGNFIANHVSVTATSLSGNASATGGAITNIGNYSPATIGSITGNFIGNYAKATVTGDASHIAFARGGAIYNYSYTSAGSPTTTIGKIEGNFIGNFVESSSQMEQATAAYSSGGGAIYNSYGAVIGATDEDGELIVVDDDGNPVIAISGTFINNYAKTTGVTYAYGGAIFNDSSQAEIGNIQADFIGNYAEATGSGAWGGAIYNSGDIASLGTTSKINFIGNSVKTTGTDFAQGGAIYNHGRLGTVYADFIGNSATTTGTYALGGAIYNRYYVDDGGTTHYGEIVSINGDFIGNYAESTGEGETSYAWGGAIYNIGYIGTAQSDGIAIQSNFIGNYAMSTANDSYGGAIYNDGYIGAVSLENDVVTVSVEGIANSTFIENEATRGGAIYNGTDKSTAEANGGIEEGEYNGIITSIDGTSFVSNVATKYGGAIYNYADGAILSITSSNFLENEATDGNGGAIENAEASSYIGNIAGNYFYGNKVVTGEHGGGALYSEGKIDGITGNVFVENTSGNFGGAIYNNGGAIGGSGGSEDSTEESAGAGSTITVGGITGNYFEGNVSDRGGAIYNSKNRTLVTVTTGTGGDTTTEQLQIFNLDSVGEIKSIDGNTFVNNVGNDYAGAIYNYHSASIGSISGNYFSGNRADDGNGGAVENAEFDASIGTMDGNVFVNNSASRNGGAIYNQGTIGIIRGDENSGDTVNVAISNSTFIGNTAQNGGAIYNNYTTSYTTMYVYAQSGEEGRGYLCTNGYLVTDTDIVNTSDSFNAEDVKTAEDGSYYYETSNGNIFVTKTEETAEDGSVTTTYTPTYVVSLIPINGAGAIGEIQCSYFEGNQATNGSGGAIYIASGTVTDEETGESTAYTATIGKITNTSFVNNSATDKGGAIYSASDITIAADGSMDGSTVLIQGNTASNGSDDNAIYMAIDQTTGKAGDLTFSLDNGGTIYLFDNIKGETGTDEEGESVGYNVVITGTGTENKFFLLNDVNAVSDVSPASIKPYAEETTSLGYNNADLSIGGVSLYTTQYTLSDEVHTYKTNSFTVTDNFDMYADVDFKNEVMDHFETSDDNNGEGKLDAGDGVTNGHSGTLNVAGLNGLTDTDADRVAVYFAEDGLKMNVTSSAGTVYAPIFTYSANYVYLDTPDGGGEQEIYYNGEKVASVSDSELFSSGDYSDAGYFVFDKTGFNPAVMGTSMATMGAFNAFGMMFEYNFEHSDYYMKLPEEVRIVKKKEEEEERKEAQMAESDPTKPQYYNRHELTYHGAWTKSFFSNESVDYGGGWDSRDKYYGAMFGFDTDMKFHDNGWATVFTGYVGTMGIRQQYSGGHIKQHGGFLGATASFYNGNFYSAWTIAGGTTKAHEHTMYGHDKDRIDEYGAAARLGWNIDLGDAKLSLLPTFTASYTYIHPEDFTNAANVHIAGSGFRAVQLNPNIKLIWNRDDGWQPYLTVGEVWTVGDRMHLRANGEKLPELDLDPYTEYGIGIQKRWAYDKDAYIQFLGHSHGRDGFLINAGIRWNF